MSEPGPPALSALDAAFKAEQFLIAGRPDLAEKAAMAALVENPQDALLHVVLGRALREMGREEDAHREFAQALALDPESGHARFHLGLSTMKAGRHREAEAIFIEGLRLDPTDADLYHAYGILLLKTGHEEKAERLVRTALSIEPDQPAYLSTLSRILTARGSKAASAVATRGVALRPEVDYSHSSLAFALFESGRPFAARRHLREALRLDPDDERLERAWREVDLACRWICLPLYYWTHLVKRLPGKQFAVWGAVVGLVFVGPSLGLSGDLLFPLSLAYLVFCVYTWVATPLGRLWTRILPPR